MDYFTKLFKQKFEIGLEGDEKIFLSVRKHWIALLSPGIEIFLAIFIPGIFIDFIFGNIVLLILFLAWFAFILGYSLYHSIRWYYDSFIITDKKIIDIDQKGVFTRNVSEATFEKVQDVTYEVKGFFGTALNYGDIVVQTAAAKENLEMTFVSKPKKIQDKIAKLQKDFKQEDEEREEYKNNKELSARELISFIENTKVNNEKKANKSDKNKQD